MHSLIHVSLFVGFCSLVRINFEFRRKILKMPNGNEDFAEAAGPCSLMFNGEIWDFFFNLLRIAANQTKEEKNNIEVVMILHAKIMCKMLVMHSRWNQHHVDLYCAFYTSTFCLTFWNINLMELYEIKDIVTGFNTNNDEKSSHLCKIISSAVQRMRRSCCCLSEMFFKSSSRILEASRNFTFQ